MAVLPLRVVHLARVLALRGARGAEEVVDGLLDHALGATGALVVVGTEVGLLPLTHWATILTEWQDTSCGGSGVSLHALIITYKYISSTIIG